MLFQIPKLFLSFKIFSSSPSSLLNSNTFPSSQLTIHSFQNINPLYINHSFIFIFFTLNSLIDLPLQSLKHNLFYFHFSLYFHYFLLHFLSNLNLLIQYTIEREPRKKSVAQRRLRRCGGSSSNPSQQEERLVRPFPSTIRFGHEG